ncbi:MAG: phosphatase PAP2 family protein [Candidatus Glassbacteria bacterium]
MSVSPFSSSPICNFLSRRPLTIVLIGGVAAWFCSQVDDDEKMARMLDGDNLYIESWGDLGDVYGNGATLAIGTLGLFLAGHFEECPGLTQAGGDLARSLLLSGAIVWSLKLGINRQRPSGGRYSFPSGHTAAAFSVAPVLHHHFGWKVGIGAYSIAAFAGLGRMEDRRHYLSDVLFGAAVGLAVADAVVNRERLVSLSDHLSINSRGISIHSSF